VSPQEVEFDRFYHKQMENYYFSNALHYYAPFLLLSFMGMRKNTYWDRTTRKKTVFVTTILVLDSARLKVKPSASIPVEIIKKKHSRQLNYSENY